MRVTGEQKRMTAAVGTHEDAERGVSEIVGYALLFSIVAVGSISVFVFGGAVLDGLNDDLTSEQVESTIDVVDSEVETALVSDRIHALPESEYAQAAATTDGTLRVEWANGSETTEASTTLGALRMDGERTTFVHQGGGIWRDEGTGVGTYKPPAIGFEPSDELRVDLLHLSPADDGITPSTVTAQSPHDDSVREIESLLAEPQGENLTIEIESEYADGWERHFEDEIEDVTRWSTAVSRTGDRVALEVDGIGRFDDDDPFFVVDDPSLEGTTNAESSIVTHGEPFTLNSTIRNLNDAPASPNVTFSVWDELDTPVESVTVEYDDELDRDDSLQTTALGESNWTSGFLFDTVGSGQESINLTPGTVYEYDIEPEPGTDSLAERGSFYYGLPGVNASVVDSTTSENGPISAEVKNVGVENGTARLDLAIVDETGQPVLEETAEPEIPRGQTATAEWSVNESSWPNGIYEYEISANDSTHTGNFTVDNGQDNRGVFVSGDEGIPATTQADGFSGQTLVAGEPLTVEATVTNSFDSTQSRTVSLEVFSPEDERHHSVREVTLDPVDTESIALTDNEANFDVGTEYEYDILINGTGLDERGSFQVVEHSGASNVSVDSVTTRDAVSPGETLSVDATFESDGPGDQFVWLQGFDESIVDSQTVTFDDHGTAETTLSWEEVDAPPGDEQPAVTVGTGSDQVTTSIDVSPQLLISDVDIGAESVEPGDSVDISVLVEGVAGDVDQTVTLVGLDGGVVDTEHVSISADEQEWIDLEYDSVGDGTDRVTVETHADIAEAVLVVERDGPECGTVEYDGAGTRSNPYQISTVDELQCMNQQLDAHYELVDDIDAQGTEFWNDGSGFDPVGSTGNRYTVEGAGDDPASWELFEGTFDGNGHVIEGLTIDRPDEEFVGLFGATNFPRNDHGRAPGEGSLIENVRLADVSVHGERHVGGLVGQAGGTVRDSRSNGTVEAGYQLVGGLIGDGAHADLDNRLVAEGTVIGGDYRTPTEETASYRDQTYYWNRGIGGLLGRSTWQTDVSTAYTEVEVRGPSMIGGIVGSSSQVRSDFTQMYTAAELQIESDPGESERPAYQGAIAGTIENDDDAFRTSVYHDRSAPFTSETFGDEYFTGGGWTDDAISRETNQMQGLGVNVPDRLGNLEFTAEGGDWVAIPEEYPRFEWELEAEGAFDVTIDEVRNTTAGGILEVDATVRSLYQDEMESTVAQTIALTDSDGNIVDTRHVELPSTLDQHEETAVTFQWLTDESDAGFGTVTVRSEDTEDSSPVSIEALDTQRGSANVTTPSLSIDATSSSGEGGPLELSTGTTDSPDRPLTASSMVTVDLNAVDVE